VPIASNTGAASAGFSAHIATKRAIDRFDLFIVPSSFD
jgi:hypothetical protein